MDKEKLKESQYKLQYIHSQIQEVEKQSEMLNQQSNEMKMSIQYLDDFGKLKEGTEILVPINQGMYARAKLLDTKDLLVNVGSDVSVKKDIQGTKKLLEKQIDEIKKVQERMVLNLQELAIQANKVEEEIKSMQNV